MPVNQDLLEKGVRKLLLLILLLIVSPITLNIAFKALTKMEDSLFIAYGILALAVVLIILTLILAFKTVKTFLDALFNK
ncbi:MAG: hypothetical protein ACI9SI_001061 [Polaribacter sp.]|jgi:hypothetical protein